MTYQGVNVEGLEAYNAHFFFTVTIISVKIYFLDDLVIRI